MQLHEAEMRRCVIYFVLWGCLKFGVLMGKPSLADITKQQSVITFPIRDFFGTSFLNNSKSSGLDKYLCDNGQRSSCCDCSENCMRFRTCCVDKLWDGNKGMALDTYLKLFEVESKKFKEFSCEFVLPKYNADNKQSSEMVLMVTKCMPGASEHDIMNCENEQDTSLPVLGDDNYTYKNEYCARCNFVNKFVVLNVTAGCAKASGKPTSINDLYGCKFHLVRNTLTSSWIKTCDRTTSNRKCDKGNPNYDLCHAYAGKILNYANYHCFKCNEESMATSVTSYESCGHVDNLVVTAPLVSISVLITPERLIFNGDTVTKCRNNTAYNYLTGRCGNESVPLPPPWLRKTKVIEEYVTLVGLAFSICCYVLIVFTFLLHKELGNVSGCLALGLCSTLLFTDSLFLIASVIPDVEKIKQACTAIAILMHYGNLMAHAWSLVIACYLASHILTLDTRPVIAFFRMITPQHKNDSIVLRRACYCATLLPLLIVALSIALNYTGVFHVGYAEGRFCFITAFYGKLLFYILPAAIVFIINISMLVLMLCRIRKHADESTIAFILLRLSMIFGITELFGFVQIYQSDLSNDELIFNEVFIMIYVVLRSFRGVMLFMTYVCRRQVFSLYRENWRRRSKRKSNEMTTLIIGK